MIPSLKAENPPRQAGLQGNAQEKVAKASGDQGDQEHLGPRNGFQAFE